MLPLHPALQGRWRIQSFTCSSCVHPPSTPPSTQRGFARGRSPGDPRLHCPCRIPQPGPARSASATHPALRARLQTAVSQKYPKKFPSTVRLQEGGSGQGSGRAGGAGQLAVSHQAVSTFPGLQALGLGSARGPGWADLWDLSRLAVVPGGNGTALGDRNVPTPLNSSPDAAPSLPGDRVLLRPRNTFPTPRCCRPPPWPVPSMLFANRAPGHEGLLAGAASLSSTYRPIYSSS